MSDKQKIILTKIKKSGNKKTHTNKSDNNTCLGFLKEKAVDINEYCLNTKTNELFYAGDMIGQMAVNQNKHYLKVLKCSLIEKDRTFPAVPKTEHGKILSENRILRVKYDKLKEDNEKLTIILKTRKKVDMLKSLSNSDFEKMRKEFEYCIPKEKVREDKEELAKQIKAIYYFESVGVDNGNCISDNGQERIDKKIKQLLGEK